MSNLLKNMIWPIIILGILLAIIYYRAFLFTSDFNLPVDAVIDDTSKSLNLEIPSHKLSDGEKSLYNTLFDDDIPANNTQFSEHTEIEADINSNNASIATETQSEDSSEHDLDLNEIVLAVKNTVDEALEVFKSENKHDINIPSSDQETVLTNNELLFKARLAYWNRDLKTAEETYLKLTEITDDPNAYGELGNLYYIQSKWKKASDAYYHAAVKLNSIQNIDQALHLLRIIRGLDSETANKLQSELQHSS